MTVPRTPGVSIDRMEILADGFALEVSGRIMSAWPVAQLGARVYDLVADAQRGVPLLALAEYYKASRQEIYITLLHHGWAPAESAEERARLDCAHRRYTGATHAAYTHPKD